MRDPPIYTTRCIDGNMTIFAMRWTGLFLHKSAGVTAAKVVTGREKLSPKVDLLKKSLAKTTALASSVVAPVSTIRFTSIHSQRSCSFQDPNQTMKAWLSSDNKHFMIKTCRVCFVVLHLPQKEGKLNPGIQPWSIPKAEKTVRLTNCISDSNDYPLVN